MGRQIIRGGECLGEGPLAPSGGKVPGSKIFLNIGSTSGFSSPGQEIKSDYEIRGIGRGSCL